MPHDPATQLPSTDRSLPTTLLRTPRTAMRCAVLRWGMVVHIAYALILLDATSGGGQGGGDEVFCRVCPYLPSYRSISKVRYGHSVCLRGFLPHTTALPGASGTEIAYGATSSTSARHSWRSLSSYELPMPCPEADRQIADSGYGATGLLCRVRCYGLAVPCAVLSVRVWAAGRRRSGAGCGEGSEKGMP
eukprot:3941354-Rhodomonas_salina.2